MGVGTGRATIRILRKITDINIYAVIVSEKMTLEYLGLDQEVREQMLDAIDFG